MNDLLHAADQMFRVIWPEACSTYSHSQLGFDIPVNAYETKNSIIVDVFVPGVKKENLNISLESGVLTIYGKLDLEFPKDAQMLVQNAYSGEFSKKIKLGRGLDPEQVIAKISSGILTITISKMEKPKPNKILVED